MHGLGGAIDGDVGAAEFFEGEDILEDVVVTAQLPVDGVGERGEASVAAGNQVEFAPGGVNDYVLVSAEGQETELLRMGDAEALV